MRIGRLRGSLITTAAVVSLAIGGGATAADGAATAAGGKVQAFKIGSYSAFALKDGDIQEPNDGKSFVVGKTPAEVAAVLKAGGAPGDHFEFSIQPLLVRAGTRVLLFDAGAGTNFGAGAGKLTQSMAAAGIDSAGVTDIFISHAHGDHIGGLVTSAGKLTFPNASVHLSAPEWQWLSSMNPKDAKNIGLEDQAGLVAAIRPKVVPFQPGSVLVPGVVEAVEIKGHTPGHSAYQIGSDTNTILYIGDSMHSYLVSVGKPSWHVMFDTDQQVGAESRTALVARSASSGQRIYAVHFPFPGVGKIVQEKAGYRWMPEAMH
jgi:glyoxylase-like metal-dependent hydrolase (beta-lactamase superfamily II)